MDVHIENPELLIEQIEGVRQINNNILRVQEDLYAISTKISNAWQSETEDKTSYLGVLNKNLNKMASLAQAITLLSKTLQTYAENQIKNANNRM